MSSLSGFGSCRAVGYLLPMDHARSDLSAFLLEFTDVQHELPDDADVFDIFGIDGDDGSEFIEAFAASFGVDVSNYRWYFHHAEEGWNFGALFFRPPYARVPRLPITPTILLEAIRTKRWPMEYPDHRLPKARWDVRLNLAAIVLPPIAAAAFWLWRKLAP